MEAVCYTEEEKALLEHYWKQGMVGGGRVHRSLIEEVVKNIGREEIQFKNVKYWIGNRNRKERRRKEQQRERRKEQRERRKKPQREMALQQAQLQPTFQQTLENMSFQQLSCLQQELERCLCSDFLSFLPPEMAFKILGYLEVEDLLRGLRVSSKWRQFIIEAIPVWKAVAAKKHGPSHLLAEELRFRLPVPIYDLLKGGTETDIPQKPHLFYPHARITWKDKFTRGDVPFCLHHGQRQTTLINGKVYVGCGSKNDYKVFSYISAENTWSSQPDCPVKWFGMGQLDGTVVAIGGKRRADDTTTNEVYVLDEDSQSWKDAIIPPMTTPRYGPAVLSHHSSLIVAGGVSGHLTSVVELFQRDTSQWYRTCPLPFPCYSMSAVIIQRTAFLLGGCVRHRDYSNKVVYASVDSLLQKSLPPDQTSEDSDSVWKTLPNTPHYGSVVTTISGCLLAVGGTSSAKRWTTSQKEIYVYSTSTSSWLYASDLPRTFTDSPAVLSTTEFLLLGLVSFYGTIKYYHV